MEKSDRPLTRKQEAFALAFVEHRDATAAYRAAYEAENMAPATIWREASLLLAHPKVAARIKELRAPVAANVQLTLEQHLSDLQRLRDAALAGQKYSAAVQAEIARGKASGLYIERIEQTGKDRGPQELSLTHAASASLCQALKERLHRRDM